MNFVFLQLHEMTASYSEISFDSQPSPADASITEDQSFPVSNASTELEAMGQSEKRNIEKAQCQSFEDFPHECDSKRPDTLDLKKYKNEGTFTNTDALKYHKALEDLHLEGTVTQEGDMVLFVAEDLETKIKLASPVSKKGGESHTFITYIIFIVAFLLICCTVIYNII